jgi:hypothetical protein
VCMENGTLSRVCGVVRLLGFPCKHPGAVQGRGGGIRNWAAEIEDDDDDDDDDDDTTGGGSSRATGPDAGPS